MKPRTSGPRISEPARCMAMVPPDGLDRRPHRCWHKAKQDGYCRQHHPDAVLRRRARKEAGILWDSDPANPEFASGASSAESSEDPT